MDLTFTAGQFNSWRGTGLNGRTLFTVSPDTVSPDTARNGTTVTLRTSLPGLREHTTIEAPDGCNKYSPETRTKAMHIAARALSKWAAETLGVHLDVNIVDNT